MFESTGRRVYVVDDDELILDMMTNLLEDLGYLTQSFSSGTAFLEAQPKLSPALVFMDVRMPDLDGMEVLNRLRVHWKSVPVVMVTGFGDVPMAVAAMRAGASEFLQKPFKREELQAVIQRVSSSGDTTGLQPYETDGTSAEIMASRENIDRLTDRELEVLRLLAEGDQNKTVAKKLQISPRTVEVHRARIMQRLGVSSFAEMVRVAVLSELHTD